jgi:hypothetical protein
MGEYFIMNFLQKIFCKHNNSEEIARYYKTYGYWQTTEKPTTEVDCYIVYKCNECKKYYKKHVLNKRFLGWNNNVLFVKDVVEPHGFISYEDYVLK